MARSVTSAVDRPCSAAMRVRDRPARKHGAFLEVAPDSALALRPDARVGGERGSRARTDAPHGAIKAHASAHSALRGSNFRDRRIKRRLFVPLGASAIGSSCRQPRRSNGVVGRFPGRFRQATFPLHPTPTVLRRRTAQNNHRAARRQYSFISRHVHGNHSRARRSSTRGVRPCPCAPLSCRPHQQPRRPRSAALRFTSRPRSERFCRAFKRSQVCVQRTSEAPQPFRGAVAFLLHRPARRFLLRRVRTAASASSAIHDRGLVFLPPLQLPTA